jgi:hypothetical protein
MIIFSWLQNQSKKSSIVIEKEKEPINKNIVIRNKTKLPENSNGFNYVKNNDAIGNKDNILIDDEVSEFYKNKNKDRQIKNLANKPYEIDKEEVISNQESGLREYLSNDILINGIILSEIIAPPRALKPYNFKRYKRLG